jgi:hypothetical protein
MLAAGRMVGFLTTTDYENMIRIGQSETFNPARGTVLGWEAEDFGAVVLWLKSRGVESEKYAFVEDRELGI